MSHLRERFILRPFLLALHSLAKRNTQVDLTAVASQLPRSPIVHDSVVSWAGRHHRLERTPSNGTIPPSIPMAFVNTWIPTDGSEPVYVLVCTDVLDPVNLDLVQVTFEARRGYILCSDRTIPPSDCKVSPVQKAENFFSPGLALRQRTCAYTCPTPTSSLNQGLVILRRICPVIQQDVLHAYIQPMPPTHLFSPISTGS